ncbi:MAG: aldose 1-epimerase [Calditrichaeota bacterium]|nr:MAG: aldose 1-epimerase [Calditrichota bacterium]
MFDIKSIPSGAYDKIQLTNNKNGEFVSIFPQLGGMLHQICLRKNETNYQILDACRDEAELKINDKAKGAKLFPFANRINDGCYAFGGENYQLPINWPQEGHAIHGFVRDKVFAIAQEEITEDYCAISLSYEFDGQFPGYPFPFLLEIQYKITAHSEVIVTTKATNTGHENMPFGDGWHCYFQLGESADNLHLCLPARNSIVVDHRGIPTGEEKLDHSFLQLTKIGDGFLDSGFKLGIVSEKAVARLFDPEQNVSIEVWQESGKGKYNFMQVFVPPSRRSVAIEPMTSMTDSFNNKSGLQVLAPDEKYHASWGVKLS